MSPDQSAPTPAGPYGKAAEGQETYQSWTVADDEGCGVGITFTGPDAESDADEHAETLNGAWEKGYASGLNAHQRNADTIADLTRQRDEAVDLLRECVAEVERLAEWLDSTGDFEAHKPTSSVLERASALLSGVDGCECSALRARVAEVESAMRDWCVCFHCGDRFRNSEGDAHGEKCEKHPQRKWESALASLVAAVERSWSGEGWDTSNSSGQAPTHELEAMIRARALLGTAPQAKPRAALAKVEKP